MQMDISVFHAKTELPMKAPTLLSSTPTFPPQLGVSLPLRPTLGTSNDGPVNIVTTKFDDPSAQKIGPVTMKTVLDRLEKNITPQFFIPPLLAPKTVHGPSQAPETRPSDASGTSQTIGGPTIHSTSKATSQKHGFVVGKDSKHPINASDLPPVSKTNPSEDASKTVTDASQLSQDSTIPIDEDAQRPHSRAIPSDPKNAPRFQVHRAQGDSPILSSIPSSTLVTQTPVSDARPSGTKSSPQVQVHSPAESLIREFITPPTSITQTRYNDVRSEERVQAAKTSTKFSQGFLNEPNPPLVAFRSTVMTAGHSVSPSRNPLTMTSRSSPVVTQSEVTTFPHPSPALRFPATVGQDSPFHLRAPSSPPKDVTIPSPASTIQPTPTSTTRQSHDSFVNVHATSLLPSHDMHIPSHNDTLTPPAMHASSHHITSFPETSTINLKTSDPYPAGVSSVAQGNSQAHPSSTTHRSSIPKPYQSVNDDPSGSLVTTQRSSTAPIPHVSTRATSKLHDSSVRTRDHLGTTPSASHSNMSQPNLHPHHFGPSTYYAPSSATVQAQPNIISQASTIPASGYPHRSGNTVYQHASSTSIVQPPSNVLPQHSSVPLASSNLHRSGPSTYQQPSLSIVPARSNGPTQPSTVPSIDISQTTPGRTQVSAVHRPQAATQSVPYSHSTRDAQTTSTVTRVPVSTLAPATATKKPQLVRSASSESEILLKTPSSLAPSRPPSRTASNTLPIIPPQERHKKNTVFDIFKPKTAGDLQPYERPSSKTSQRDESRSRSHSSSKASIPNVGSTTKSRAPTPNASSVPTPITSVPAPSGRTSPRAIVFTPFRLFISTRQRRISTASLEAVDGTAVSAGSFNSKCLSNTSVRRIL